MSIWGEGERLREPTVAHEASEEHGFPAGDRDRASHFTLRHRRCQRSGTRVIGDIADLLFDVQQHVAVCVCARSHQKIIGWIHVGAGIVSKALIAMIESPPPLYLMTPKWSRSDARSQTISAIDDKRWLGSQKMRNPGVEG
jgi:hypothetical protein